MPRPSASFERVHTAGPIELFRGAALAGVGRVVQVSALGVGAAAEARRSRDYLRSKRLADEALLACDVDAAVVRPSLVFGPGSQSAALFATLASLPVIGLPGHGRAARCSRSMCSSSPRSSPRLVERTGSCARRLRARRQAAVDYREMLGRVPRGPGPRRRGLAAACRCRLMALGARLAEPLPQQRVLPRHAAPARARQRAGAQRRAGAARPRAEQARRRPGGDAAAAAVRLPGRCSPRRSSSALRGCRSPSSGSTPR